MRAGPHGLPSILEGPPGYLRYNRFLCASMNGVGHSAVIVREEA
jgi:hypothetical protein